MSGHRDMRFRTLADYEKGCSENDLPKYEVKFKLTPDNKPCREWLEAEVQVTTIPMDEAFNCFG